MALSYRLHYGNGVLTSFSFAGIEFLPADVVSISDQIKVYVNGVLITSGYTVDVANEEIDFVTVYTSADAIKIARETEDGSRLVDYSDATNLTAALLNLDSDQLFFLLQELIDGVVDALSKDNDGIWNAAGIRIKNLGAAINGGDAVTLSQMQAALTGLTPMSVSGFGVFTATATAAQTDFPLTGGPSGLGASDYLVFVNGLEQQGSLHYSVTSGTPDTVVFTTGLAASDLVEVKWTTGVVVGLLGDNSVTTSMIVDEAVTQAKIAPGTDGQALMTRSGAADWDTIVPADISGFDAQVQTNKLNDMTAPDGNVSMNSQRITSLGTPSSSSDAATKGYADALTFINYQTGSFTPGDGTVNFTTPWQARGAIINWSVGAGSDVDHTAIFPSDGFDFTFTESGVIYTVTRTSSSNVRITRNNTAGTIGLRFIFLKA